MGAGLSTKQINGRIYNRLQTVKRQLERAGVAVIYKDYSLVRYETEHTQKIGGFNISYRISRASNGETAGFAGVLISGALQGDGRYSRMASEGTFEQGIAKVIEIFGEPELVFTAMDTLGMIPRRSR